MRAAIVFLSINLLLLGQEEVGDWTKSGQASFSKGDYLASQKMFAEAWKIAETLPNDDPKRYEILKLQAAAASALGQYQEAEGFLQLAINWREVSIGREDPKIADDLTEVAMLCRAMKDLDRGLAVLQRVAAMHTRLAAGQLPLADDYSRTAQFYEDLKNTGEAVGALRMAIGLREKAQGIDHPALLGELDRLAAGLVKLRQYENAVPAYMRALVIRERIIGRESPDLIPNIDGLAYAYFGMKQFKEAEQFYVRLLQLWVSTFGEAHPMVALTLDKITVFYREQERFDEARKAGERAIAVRERFLADGLMREGDAQASRGNRKDAAPFYERAIAILDAHRAEHESAIKDIEKRIAVMNRLPRGK